MTISYRNFEIADTPAVSQLMFSLYNEDPGDKPMNSGKIKKTIAFLTENPERGSIVVFDKEGAVVGYAILINYWSNEFGGNIVIIDELYVKKGYRSRGTGSRFIEFLKNRESGRSVALQLEVSPENEKACRLYSRLGFKPHKNTMYDLEL